MRWGGRSGGSRWGPGEILTGVAIVASGGAQVGGSAVLSVTRAAIGSSGVQVSGASTIARTAAETGSSGVQVGGAATIARTRVLIPTSGVAVSGAATLTRSRADAGSGGIDVAGDAGENDQTSVTGHGGVQVTGSASVDVVSAAVLTPRAGGGRIIVVSESQPTYRPRTIEIIGRGGLTVGGHARITRHTAILAIGGVAVAGTARPSTYDARPDRLRRDDEVLLWLLEAA